MAALIDDSIESLASAESRLRDQRKDVWWITWLCELQMRVLVRATQFRKQVNGSIETSTHLDHDYKRCTGLYFQGIRMIRLDAMRMARLTRLYLEFINLLTDVDKRSKSVKSDLLSGLRECMKIRERRRLIKQPPLECAIEQLVDDAISEGEQYLVKSVG
jgi:hypothetical protein